MNHGVQVRADDPETIMLDVVFLISRYTGPGSVARRVKMQGTAPLRYVKESAR
jgi:hypothetical protein